MNWTNVWLLWRREMIDQLRDRRTLFTVVVLPLLLYPMLGISLIQVTQFFRERPARIWFIGTHHLPSELSLIEDNAISPQWASAEEGKLIELECDETVPDGLLDTLGDAATSSQNSRLNEMVRNELSQRRADLAVLVPHPIDWTPSAAPGGADQESGPLDLMIFVNSASDASLAAKQRLETVLKRWKLGLFEHSLQQQQIPVGALKRLTTRTEELAKSESQRLALWSKVLPLMIVLWCLTGAFYPAVDVCAGEKERGTFETILSSPAVRSEIAWGKLLTVVSFSSVTALLNLISLTVTALFVTQRFSSSASMPWGNLGLPPWTCLIWIPLAVAPIALFFSAVSLAAAAFARSSKEGQYYLVPLIMISMPMMMLTMTPAAQLELGTSLIPITGLMLLLRGAIEGRYAEVLPYVAPVVAVMIVCVWASVRWVIYQFNSESVLFRASERFALGSWFRRIMHERGSLPTLGQAALCFVVILLAKFFLSFSLSVPRDWAIFTTQTVTLLLAAIAMPAILMSMVLTRRPMTALKLVRCRWSQAAAAVLLAIALHPLMTWLGALVMAVYPPSDGLLAMNEWMGQLFLQAPSLWAVLAIIAIVPAISEELAFRGFILGGFQRLKGSLPAILVSAFCFGAAHSVFQQSLMTFVVGLVLGTLAVRTGSLIPCMLFHAVHNALSFLISEHSPLAWERLWPIFNERSAGSGLGYAVVPGLAMTAAGFLLLVWVWRQANAGDVADETRTSSLAGRHRLSAAVAKLRGLAHFAKPRR